MGKRSSADVLVVGAGPGGIGSAAMLERRGLSVVVLERGAGVGAKWRNGYDSLHINTSAWVSHLPGMRFSPQAGRWPSRDEVVELYERYAGKHRLDVRTRVEATRAERDGGGWRLETSEGSLTARGLVIATGKERAPHIPGWPGRKRFSGSLLHSSDYRNALPYMGQSSLVVGGGNSAMDIALDLASGGARTVALSLRSPAHLMKRSTAGLPFDVMTILTSPVPAAVLDPMSKLVRHATYGDLSRHGLPTPTEGTVRWNARTGRVPIIEDGRFIRAVKAGQIKIVPGVVGLREHAARLADGSETEAETLVAATGYWPALDGLVGHLGLLDANGYPVIDGPESHPSAAGLRFIGYTDPRTGNLRELRLDSKRVARSLAKELHRPGR